MLFFKIHPEQPAWASTVLLSDTKMCVRMEMSPGRSATRMVSHWLLVGSSRGLFLLGEEEGLGLRLVTGTVEEGVGAWGASLRPWVNWEEMEMRNDLQSRK